MVPASVLTVHLRKVFSALAQSFEKGAVQSGVREGGGFHTPVRGFFSWQ